MKGKKSSWPAELSSATSTLFVNQYAQGWFMGEPSSLGCFCNSLLDLEDASFGSPLTAVHSTPGFCLSTLLGSFFIPSDGTVGWELLKTYLLTALLHRIWSGPLKTRSLFHQSLEMLASLDSLSCYQVDCSSQLLAWDFFFFRCQSSSMWLFLQTISLSEVPCEVPLTQFRMSGRRCPLLQH